MTHAWGTAEPLVEWARVFASIAYCFQFNSGYNKPSYELWSGFELQPYGSQTGEELLNEFMQWNRSDYILPDSHFCTNDELFLDIYYFISLCDGPQHLWTICYELKIGLCSCAAQ